ncbi:MAG: preprotein translocase subunit YajC [Pseudomonadota bacterium]
MSLFIAEAYANTGAAPAGPSAWSQIIMLGIFALVFYFLLLRPQLKRQKEHKVLMEALQKGDEVVFAGGLVGTVSKIDGDFAVIELASNVEVKVQRASVVATLPKGTIKNI